MKTHDDSVDDFRYSATVHHNFQEYKAPVKIAVIHDDRCQTDVVHLAINGWVVAALSKEPSTPSTDEIDLTTEFQEGLDKIFDDATKKMDNKGVDPTIGGIKDLVKKLQRLRKQHDILKSHLDELHDKIALTQLDIEKTDAEIRQSTSKESMAVVTSMFPFETHFYEDFNPDEHWPRKL